VHPRGLAARLAAICVAFLGHAAWLARTFVAFVVGFAILMVLIVVGGVFAGVTHGFKFVFNIAAAAGPAALVVAAVVAAGAYTRPLSAQSEPFLTQNTP